MPLKNIMTTKLRLASAKTGYISGNYWDKLSEGLKWVIWLS